MNIKTSEELDRDFAQYERDTAGEEIITTKSGGKYLRSSIITPHKDLIRSVDWLWEPYLARGMMTTSEGMSDLGKSLAWTDIIARLSSMQELPGGKRFDKPIGSVIIAYEDDIDIAIAPRLYAAGADFSKIRILPAIRMPGEDYPIPYQLDLPEHRELVEIAIQEVEAGVLFIDPITSSFSRSIDINQQADVRRALFYLNGVAVKYDMCTVNQRHHKKGKSGSIKEQGTGSNAFQEVPRAGVAFYEDPDDDTGDTKLFVHFKKNLHVRVKPRKYTIYDQNGIARIRWLDQSDLTDKQIYDGQRTSKVGEMRTDVLPLFKHTRCMTTTEIARELGMVDEAGTVDTKEYNKLTHTLSRMVKAIPPELIQPSKGKYCRVEKDAGVP